MCNLGELPKKKPVFFGRSLPNLFTHPPTPGFLWDLGDRKVKFGSKKAIFGVIWGVLRGLDLVWESATPPTHIWKRYPKKNFFFWGSFPKWKAWIVCSSNHWIFSGNQRGKGICWTRRRRTMQCWRESNKWRRFREWVNNWCWKFGLSCWCHCCVSSGWDLTLHSVWSTFCHETLLNLQESLWIFKAL